MLILKQISWENCFSCGIKNKDFFWHPKDSVFTVTSLTLRKIKVKHEFLQMIGKNTTHSDVKKEYLLMYFIYTKPQGLKVDRNKTK